MTKAKIPQVRKGSGLVRAIAPALISLTPNLRVRVAPMEPVASKEPIGERGDNSTDNYQGKSCPVHITLDKCRRSVRDYIVGFKGNSRSEGLASVRKVTSLGERRVGVWNGCILLWC